MPIKKLVVVLVFCMVWPVVRLWADSETDKPIQAIPDARVTAPTGPADSLDELKRLLMLQAEQIKALRQRVDDQAGELKQLKEAGPRLVPASLVSSAAGNDSASPAAVPGAAQVTASPAAQDKLEERIGKIGPLRFGGDFRLRFDSIIRSSKALEGGSTLSNAQNNRMRYRFRFNMDTDLDPTVSFHGQLSTGPANNALTLDQDFNSTVTRHPFLISEAWVDYHPSRAFSVQAGRLQEAFADNSRFIFDDDVRFNGFNEKFVYQLKSPVFKLQSIELRAGQYIFSNPNVAVIAPGSPLAQAGAVIGTRSRAAQMFHQGFLLHQTLGDGLRQQFGGDVQVYRNPSQIALSSTTDGLALIVEGGLGLRLSGPLTGTGTATTTPGGFMYTAKNFQIARITYSLKHKGLDQAERWPMDFNLQLARNMGTSFERDAMLASMSVGQAKQRGDWRFLYVLAIKGASSMISQLTDDDLGTTIGTNIRTHHLRVDYAFSKKIVFQSLFFFQNALRSSGQHPSFFVPLGALTPLQTRFQQQLLFSF